MEPSARTLYHSLRATAALPEHLQILPAHGAGSACGKSLGAVPFSVLGYERRFNGALRLALHGSEDAFVKDILSGQPEPPLYFARMKRDNKRGPVLLPRGTLPQPRRLTADELPSFVFDESGHSILDLRNDRAAFMERHLTGSLFAPLAGGKLPIVAGSYVDEHTATILVVNDESQVDEAVRQLVRIGMDRVEAWIPADEALSVYVENDGLIAGVKRITAAKLAGELAAHPRGAVLDVRGTSEYARAHVRGSRHIPYTRLAVRLDEVPRANPLFVHCGSGLRASFAVAFLAREGRDVVHVDGPFDALPASIMESSSGDAAPPDWGAYRTWLAAQFQ